MKYTYLIINLLSVLFPIALSFDKRVQFYRSWRNLWPALLISGVVFVGWDMLFTEDAVWEFNPRYILGPSIGGLPLEEIMFFFTVPFACVFVYACLNYYIKWNISQLAARLISGTLLLLAVYLLAIYHSFLYTAVTFTLLLVLLLVLQYISPARWMPQFYRAYLISLVPFFLVNGQLTSIPVVLYNEHQNMGIRLGTIPFEDLFYLMDLLLLNIAIFEYLRSRRQTVSANA